MEDSDGLAIYRDRRLRRRSANGPEPAKGHTRAHACMPHACTCVRMPARALKVREPMAPRVSIYNVGAADGVGAYKSGHNNSGHTCVGHYYIGRNYIDHNYIGRWGRCSTARDGVEAKQGKPSKDKRLHNPGGLYSHGLYGCGLYSSGLY